MAHAPSDWVEKAAATGPGEAAALPGALAEAFGWHWRPEVVVPLALLGALYVAGWVRLRARAPRAAPAWRLVAHVAGVAALALALLSPIERLASVSFAVHMVQHVLLLMAAAPLLLLADPLAVVLWALPRRARHTAGNLLSAGGVRTVWRAVTGPPVAWLGAALTVWLWHLPVAYDAALQGRLLHDLEHLAFFAAGLLFWWPAINPAPRLRAGLHPGLRVVYLVLGGLQKATLGLLITLAPRVLYPSYAAAPRLFAASAIEDQAWGGVIMLTVGGLVDMTAVLVTLGKALNDEPRLAPRRVRADPGAAALP